MIQFLLAVIVLVAFALTGAIFGAIFPATFHPHTLVTPCAISQQIGPAEAATGTPFIDDLRWRVVDGDTLACENKLVDIAGFDAPEIGEGEAACERERELGAEARTRLQQILSQSSWSVADAESLADRTRVQVFIDNSDLADIMVRENFGKPWNGQGPRPDWCA